MIALNETIYTQHGCAATYILHVHLCMLCMEKLIETMEKSVETMEKSSETMEKPIETMKTIGKSKNAMEKSMKTMEKSTKTMEKPSKIMENHRKTTEKSIKPWRNRWTVQMKNLVQIQQITGFVPKCNK